MDAVAILDSLASGLGVALVVWLFKYIRDHNRQHENTQDRLLKIESEFYPNGGRSTWDRIEATYRLVEQMAKEAGHNVDPQPRKEHQK